MTSTEDLINQLVQGAAPVRRLSRPLSRAAFWLALAGMVIGGMAGVDGLCPNLPSRLMDPLYATSLGAAGLTGILAAAGAFMTGLPDRSRLWAVLPVPALLVWLGATSLSCVLCWTPTPAGFFQADGALHCGGVFLAVSAMLAGSLLWMSRRAPVADRWATAWLAGLAVAGLATLGLALTRTFAESALILVWNLGAAALTAPVLASSWRWAFRHGVPGKAA